MKVTQGPYRPVNCRITTNLLYEKYIYLFYMVLLLNMREFADYYPLLQSHTHLPVAFSIAVMIVSLIAVAGQVANENCP